MTNNWVAETWENVVRYSPTSIHHSRVAENFRRAVDTWEHTCEIILAQASHKTQGAQWDNRRVRS